MDTDELMRIVSKTIDSKFEVPEKSISECISNFNELGIDIEFNEETGEIINRGSAQKVV